MKIAPPEELRRLIALVESRLDKLPKKPGSRGYKTELARALIALRRKVGARINTKWGGCSLRIGGLSVVVTADPARALRSWVAAARRHLLALPAENADA